VTMLLCTTMQMRIDQMLLRVPYIADETIERDTEALLAQYELSRNIEIRAPVPVEDVVEKFLKLHLEFDDLPRRLGVPRVLAGKEPDICGAIWLEDGEIVIDESLDPELRPAMEGRYRFTLGHEGGHWRLHRPLIEANIRQALLFQDTRQPSVVCRLSQANERLELQANLYASCLLMPRRLIMQAWRNQFSNYNPRMIRRTDRIVVCCDEGDEIGMAEFERAQDNEVLELFARPLAAQFLVSPVAMRIRLEKLGLLLREVPRQGSLLLHS
jgi:uncharacterized protein DUF955